MARGQLNKDRLKKDRQANTNKASFFKIEDPGEYMMYIAPPQEGHDLPYVEVFKHFGIGGTGENDGGAAVCLDLRANDVLTDPRVHEFLEGGAAVVDGGCPQCELWDETKDQERKQRIGRRKSFLMNVVLIAKRPDSDSKWNRIEEPRLAIFDASYTVWEGIQALVYEHGDGILEPTEAMLVVVTRTGKGKNKTRYKVNPDVSTARTPYVFTDEFIAKLDEALAPGGAGDLFRAVARNVRTRDEIEEMAKGKGGKGKGKGEEEAEEEDEGPPKCFKMDYENVAECGKCPWRGPCSKACELDLFPGHELKPGDVLSFRGGNIEYVPEEEEAEEEKPKPRTRPKPEETKPDSQASRAKPSASKATADASRAAKPAAAKPKPEPEPEEEAGEEDDEEYDVYGEASKLGFETAQVDRMDDETLDFILDNAIPADTVSILPRGGYTLFPEKLPEDHPMYKAPKPAAKPEAAATKPRVKRRPKAEEPKPAPKEEEELEDDLDGPAAEAKGADEMNVDELERALAAASTKTRTRKTKEG